MGVRVAMFIVEVEGPDEYPADEGSADELSRLEMRAIREVDANLTLALEDVELPLGFRVTWSKAE